MSDWILLRGLMREKRHWGRFASEFESGVPGAKAHPIDLPGNGELNRQRSPTSVAEMVEACRGQASAQGLVPPYQILAVSMGAMVAVQWATAYPAEVRAAVLINTSMRPFSPIHWRLLPGNYLAILKLACWRATPREWEMTLLGITANHPREDVLQTWQILRKTHQVSALNAVRQLWAAAKYKATQQGPDAQILLLASKMDRLVSVKCSKAIAHSWGVPLRIHPTAGHDLPLDDGAWITNQVQLWSRSQTR